eukprot:4226976-Prymnesium_polylepis.1
MDAASFGVVLCALSVCVWSAAHLDHGGLDRDAAGFWNMDEEQAVVPVQHGERAGGAEGDSGHFRGADLAVGPVAFALCVKS